MSRGLAVLLVVLVHSGSIYSEWGNLPLPRWIDALDLALAPYRIPFLIFLSGIFLGRSLAKGLARFVMGKVRNLLWPFVIWTGIIVAASAGPQGWLNWQVWITGGPTLWYLSFLLIFYAVGLLFARVPVLVIAVYALAISMIAPEETRYGQRLFVLMSYFFVGAFAGEQLERFHNIIKGRWTLVLLPIMIGLSVYFATQPAGFKYSPFVAPLIVACIICMSSLINALSGGAIASSLLFVGRNSLVYYVVHPSIYFLFYRFMFDRGIIDPYLCIGIALALALAIATFVAHARLRSRTVNYLFEGPDIRLSPPLARIAGVLEAVLVPRRLLTRKPLPGEGARQQTPAA